MQPLILSSAEALERYQELRGRFPVLPREAIGERLMRKAGDLGEIAPHYDVFVFDAFGVLNVGDVPIEGACERIDTLRTLGKQIFVLTNAASYSFPQVIEKFQSLGFLFLDDELVSSRDVCEAQMRQFDPTMQWGVIAPSSFDPTEVAFDCIVLGDHREVYDSVDGFVFLSAECWQAERQMLLTSSLEKCSRPVIVANPDLVAPRQAGLTLEPGFFGHRLIDRLPDLDIAFHGKPFASVYDRIEQLIGDGMKRDRIVMMGDSLHTDILGAKVRGWGSVLVTDHGFLKGQNADQAMQTSGIYPSWIVPSI